MGKTPLAELMPNNVYFDNEVCHQPERLLKVIPANPVLYAPDMLAPRRPIGRQMGHYFDDTPLDTDNNTELSAADKQKILAGNARRVFKRLEINQ